jgi:hypothetical protein
LLLLLGEKRSRAQDESDRQSGLKEGRKEGRKEEDLGFIGTLLRVDADLSSRIPC